MLSPQLQELDKALAELEDKEVDLSRRQQLLVEDREELEGRFQLLAEQESALKVGHSALEACGRMGAAMLLPLKS